MAMLLLRMMKEGQKNTFTYDASGNKRAKQMKKEIQKLYDYNTR